MKSDQLPHPVDNLLLFSPLSTFVAKKLRGGTVILICLTGQHTMPRVPLELLIDSFTVVKTE